MLQHRFLDLVPQMVTTSVEVESAAFVQCPCPVMTMFTPAHQTFVANVYRIAQELTAAQMRPTRSRIPAFSLN